MNRSSRPHHRNRDGTCAAAHILPVKREVAALEGTDAIAVLQCDRGTVCLGVDFDIIGAEVRQTESVADGLNDLHLLRLYRTGLIASIGIYAHSTAGHLR